MVEGSDKGVHGGTSWGSIAMTLLDVWALARAIKSTILLR